MHSLKIASLNLCNFCAPPFCFYDFESSYSHAQWQQKTNWLSHLITANTPDVICFQEVFSLDALKELLTKIGLTHYAYAELPTLDEQNRFLYKRPIVVIAAKYPLSAVEALNPAPFITMNTLSRAIIKCQLVHPDFGNIRLYGCHLKSKRAMDTADVISPMPPSLHTEIGSLLANKQRFDEAMALYCDFLLAQHTALQPCFIMGDFNQQTLNTCLAYMTDETHTKQALSSDTKLLDSYNLSQLQVRKPTHYYYGNGSVLDYILCPESILSQLNLKHLDLQILDNYINQDEINLASDHAMVQLTLK